jgi:hypothetical protein
MECEHVRSEVLTAASMKMIAFWIVAPCRLHGATTQKTVVFECEHVYCYDTLVAFGFSRRTMFYGVIFKLQYRIIFK